MKGYQDLLERLANNQNFSLTRLGDGEVNAILGCPQTANCDGHVYYIDLGKRLFEAIDCGSLFDPFCGEITRSYHKNLTL